MSENHVSFQLHLRCKNVGLLRKIGCEGTVGVLKMTGKGLEMLRGTGQQIRRNFRRLLRYILDLSARIVWP